MVASLDFVRPLEGASRAQEMILAEIGQLNRQTRPLPMQRATKVSEMWLKCHISDAGRMLRDPHIWPIHPLTSAINPIVTEPWPPARNVWDLGPVESLL